MNPRAARSLRSAPISGGSSRPAHQDIAGRAQREQHPVRDEGDGSDAIR